MDILFLVVFLLFAILIAIWDIIRQVNKNLKIQTKEIRKLREELNKNK